MAKSEIRRHRVAKFVTVPKELVKDRDLTDKEVGTYTRILGLPDTKTDGEPFDFSVEGYCMYYYGTLKKHRDAVYNCLNGLIHKGWIDRYVERNEKGQFVNVVYDLLPDKRKDDAQGEAVPNKEIPNKEKPDTENPDTAKPDRENSTQIYTLSNKDSMKGIRQEPYSSQKNKSAAAEKEGIEAKREDLRKCFMQMWNVERADYVPMDAAAGLTCMFARMTDKRRKLLDKIFTTFIDTDQTGTRTINWSQIKSGIKYAMRSKRARGTVEGQTSKADLDYMLENFVKLVEGTF